MHEQLKKDGIFFYILIRSWNSFEYFDKCINSVLEQSYEKFQILFVDDCSEYSTRQKNYIKKRLYGHIVLFNKKRQYSLKNAYHLIHKYVKNNDAVVFNLDADDWLLDKTVLEYMAREYSHDPYLLLTYGECVFWQGNNNTRPSRFLRRYANIKYPNSVVFQRLYRKYPFLPLHPRTWKAGLFKKIKREDLLRPDGSWLKFAEDQAMFYPMLELAAGRYKVIKKPLYVYNISTKHSDVRENFLELLKDELLIRRKRPYEPLS